MHPERRRGRVAAGGAFDRGVQPQASIPPSAPPSTPASPCFAANAIHPLFLVWRTGPLETLSSMLRDALGLDFGFHCLVAGFAFALAGSGAGFSGAGLAGAGFGVAFFRTTGLSSAAAGAGAGPGIDAGAAASAAPASCRT